MTVIKLTVEASGAYANQTGEIQDVPNGYAAVPENLLPVWEQYKPFVTITVTDGAIISMEDNDKARQAWAATHPAPTPEPALEEYLLDLDYRLSLQELGVN